MSVFDAAVAALLLEATGALEDVASSLDICGELAAQHVVDGPTTDAVTALRRDLASIREDVAATVQRLTDDGTAAFTVPRPSACAAAATISR